MNTLLNQREFYTLQCINEHPNSNVDQITEFVFHKIGIRRRALKNIIFLLAREYITKYKADGKFVYVITPAGKAMLDFQSTANFNAAPVEKRKSIIKAIWETMRIGYNDNVPKDEIWKVISDAAGGINDVFEHDLLDLRCNGDCRVRILPGDEKITVRFMK